MKTSMKNGHEYTSEEVLYKNNRYLVQKHWNYNDDTGSITVFIIHGKNITKNLRIIVSHLYGEAEQNKEFVKLNELFEERKFKELVKEAIE